MSDKQAKITDCVQKARECLKRAFLTPRIEARIGYQWEAINHLAGALEAVCRDGESPMLTHEEMVAAVRIASASLKRYYTSGLDVPASSETTRKLDAVAAALASEPLPPEADAPSVLKEGWAFLDDLTDYWEIAWLQEQSPSARYLIVTERKA